MDLYGCFFKYAGEESEPYGLRLANVETKELTSLYGETESITIFNKRQRRWHHIGNAYDKAQLSFEIDIVSDRYIQRIDARSIQKWLFNQSGYKRLYVFNSSEHQDDIYLNCRFVNPERIETASGLIGFRCTVECDSDMAWQEPITKSFSFTDSTVDSNRQVNLTLDTDINDFTYPRVTIMTGDAGGDITVINHTDDDYRQTTIEDLPANTSVILDGSYNYITSGYYAFFNGRNFPRLLDGENTLSIMGDVRSISFEWANRRYI